MVEKVSKWFVGVQHTNVFKPILETENEDEARRAFEALRVIGPIINVDIVLIKKEFELVSTSTYAHAYNEGR